ncbi:MAG: hypothetical protein LBN21_11930 [Treponema sp.]|nr:hypothetical protein [Treponema sp.]
MSDSDNPYESPQAPAAPDGSAAPSGILTETMLRFLKDASPWLRFLGILGFISSGSLALVGIAFFALFPLMSGLLESVPGFDEISDVFGVLLGGVYGVYFIGFAAFSFVPAFFTYNFGKKISDYLRSNSEKDLELALRNNKSLWKFKGILYLIGIAFIPVISIITIIIAAVAALA